MYACMCVCFLHTYKLTYLHVHIDTYILFYLLASNRLLLNASKTQFIWLGGVWLVLTRPLLPLPFHTFAFKGPSIKYGALFWPILSPLPLSHFVTHPGTPPKVRHTSRTPR